MYASGRFFLLLLVSCVAVTGMLSLPGCGNGDDGISTGVSNVQITVPAGLAADMNAGWTVAWAGGTAPYTVAWNFGGGANPNTATATATALTQTTTVAMVNPSAVDPASYTATATITDARGGTGTATTDYTVPAPGVDSLITSCEFNAVTHTIVVNATADPTALPLTFTLAPTGDISANTLTITITEAPYIAEFFISAHDIIAGATGSASVTLTDTKSAMDQVYVDITIPALGPVVADALYAVPLQHTVDADETATVIVFTNAVANPFQFLPAVSVSYPTWVHFIGGSFDYGTLGGNAGTPDGIWGPEGMEAAFFLEAHNFAPGAEVADFGIDGRHRYQFDVNPVGGKDLIAATGPLFSFQVSFDHAGTASFGFVQTVGAVDRTYYTDSTSTNHFWGELMAGPDGTLNVTGVDNTIVVTE